jgi:outer membrane protein assembly factor BamB
VRSAGTAAAATPRMAAATRATTVAAALACAAALGTGTAGCAMTSDLSRAGNADLIAAAVARGAGPGSGPRNTGGRPVAYVVLGGAAGSRIAAFDLAASRVLWTQPANITGRIAAGRSVVVHADGDALVARETGTGRERWRAPVPRSTLAGYAVDGDDVYLVVREKTSLRGGDSDLLALDGGAGSVRWRRPLGTGNVAGPAARGGLVAVPNRSQFVRLVDGQSGQTLGEVLSREQTANFVEAQPEGLYYGYSSGGAFLLSGDTATGSRSSPGFLAAKFPPFVRPVYHFDMYRPELVAYSAIDRNRVLWRAAPVTTGGKLGARFAADAVTVLNYRFFFGFEASSGKLRWAYSHPLVEAAGATHTGAAILFVTVDGQLGALDPRTGSRLYQARLPADVVSGVTFDADGFPAGAGAAAPAAGGGAGAGAGDLAAALTSILWDQDQRFSDVKTFAVSELARIPGRAVTAELLKALQKEGMPPGVYQKAAEALGGRRDAEAVDLFVDAIRVHADHVQGLQTANLGVLARAVAAMGEAARHAAVPLSEHLRLPETEPAAVVEIARALAALKADDTLPALRDYLMTYRADPSLEGDPSPLLAVTDALVSLGGAPERELLLYVSEESRTLEPVRAYVRRALVQTAGGGGGGTGGATAAAAGAGARPAGAR